MFNEKVVTNTVQEAKSHCDLILQVNMLYMYMLAIIFQHIFSWVKLAGICCILKRLQVSENIFQVLHCFQSKSLILYFLESRSLLMECPDIVIGTPSALLGHVQAKVSFHS